MEEETQTCKWCTKEMAQEATHCPHCGKERKDIYRDKAMNNWFAAGLVSFVILFLIGAWKRTWGTFHSRFDVEEFVSSGLGIFLLISIAVCLIGTLYYGVKVARKRGTSFWAP